MLVLSVRYRRCVLMLIILAVLRGTNTALCLLWKTSFQRISKAEGAWEMWQIDNIWYFCCWFEQCIKKKSKPAVVVIVLCFVVTKGLVSLRVCCLCRWWRGQRWSCCLLTLSTCSNEETISVSLTAACQLTRRQRPRGDSCPGDRRTSFCNGCHGEHGSPDVKAPRKMPRKPPGTVTVDTGGGGVGFRGSGSVRAGGSGTALNTLSTERRTPW